MSVFVSASLSYDIYRSIPHCGPGFTGGILNVSPNNSLFFDHLYPMVLDSDPAVWAAMLTKLPLTSKQRVLLVTPEQTILVAECTNVKHVCPDEPDIRLTTIKDRFFSPEEFERPFLPLNRKCPGSLVILDGFVPPLGGQITPCTDMQMALVYDNGDNTVCFMPADNDSHKFHTRRFDKIKEIGANTYDKWVQSLPGLSEGVTLRQHVCTYGMLVLRNPEQNIRVADDALKLEWYDFDLVTGMAKSEFSGVELDGHRVAIMFHPTNPTEPLLLRC